MLILECSLLLCMDWRRREGHPGCGIKLGLSLHRDGFAAATLRLGLMTW